jgi:hypothetical protein
MTAKIRKDLSDHFHRIYEVGNGVWFVQVNHLNRNCQLTSGDVWYDISRAEAREFLLGKAA